MCRLGILLIIYFTLIIGQDANAYNKDPTMPVSYDNSLLMKTSLTIELDGIIMGKDRLLAIINGETFSVNDQIGKWKITKISADRVILTNQDKQMELKLLSTTVKESCKEKGCRS